MWEVLFVWIGGVVALAVYLYRKFGSFKERPWYVTAATLLGWSLSFLMVFLVPNDISSSRYYCCTTPTTTANCTTTITTCPTKRPFNYIDPEGLLGIWEMVYWASYILTWTMFPFMQAYSVSGSFTRLERTKDAIKANLVYFAIYGAVALVLLIIVLVKHETDVLGIFIALGNAYGLLIAIAMLGVGLVEVPRTLFRHSNRQMYLNLLYFRAVSYRKSLLNSQKKLDDVLTKVRDISYEVSRTHPLRPSLDIILSKCEDIESFKNGAVGHGKTPKGFVENVTNSMLVDLHASLLTQKFHYNRAKVLYNHVVKVAIGNEDVEKSASNPEKVIVWTFKKERTHRFAEEHDRLEFYWKHYLEVIALRTLCTLFIICSLALVWSEVIFPFEPPYSIPAAVVIGVPNHDVTLQALIFFVVTYMVYCSFFSLWKMRIFNYYRLVNHNQSDSNSLLFSAAFTCRLIAPIAYNFILMTTVPTQFQQVVGRMDTTPLLGSGFSTHYPVIILLFFFGSLFNIIPRILSAFNIKRFRYDENFSDEQILEGRALINRERLQRTREAFATNAGQLSSSSQPLLLGNTSWNSSSVSDPMLSSSSSSSSQQKKQSRVSMKTTHSVPDLLERVMETPTGPTRFGLRSSGDGIGTLTNSDGLLSSLSIQEPPPSSSPSRLRDVWNQWRNSWSRT